MNQKQPTDETLMKPGRARLLLLLTILLALLLRLIRLGTFPFWADEAYNLVLSDDLLGIFYRGHFLSTHPPMAYLLLFLWRLLGMGVNEWTVRGLPALFGVLGVIAIYWLGTQLFNKRVGLVAALILAVSPFHVLHSQDLKEYIYLPFFATLMVGFFYRAVKNNRRFDWLMYGLLAGVACYTETFVGPLLVAINCWFLCLLPSHRDCLKGWLLSNVLGALMFLPWLGMTLHKILTYMIHAEGWWVPPPSPWSMLFYFKTIAFGYADIKPFFYVATLLFSVLMLYGVYRAWLWNHQTALLLVMWAVMPVALVYMISFMGQSIFLIRSMIPYSISVYLLVALAVTRLKPGLLKYGVMTTLLLVCAVGLSAHYLRVMAPHEFPHRPGIHPPKDYDQAATYVRENIRENDVVIHTGISTWLPFYWYAFSDYPQYTGAYSEAFKSFIHDSTPLNTDDPVFMRLWPDIMERLIDGHERVWLVYSEWERDYLSHNPANVYRWMDSRFLEMEHKTFMNIDVFLFLAPTHLDAPMVYRRDADTGVTAEIYHHNQAHPYEKRAPEGTVPPLHPNQPQESSMLGFGDPAAGPPSGGGQKHEADFYLANRAGQPEEWEVHFLASSKVLAAAAFERGTPDKNTWHVAPMHNDSPPPDFYNVPALSGNFHHGEDSATGRVKLTAGSYVPYVYAAHTARGGDNGPAPMQIHIGAYLFESVDQSESSGWQWLRGRPFMTDNYQEELSVLVEENPAARGEAPYVNLAYVALVPTASLQDRHFFQESVVVSANDARQWRVSIPEGAHRVDVWAFGQGELGKALHIFEVFDGDTE